MSIMEMESKARELQELKRMREKWHWYAWADSPTGYNNKHRQREQTRDGEKSPPQGVDKVDTLPSKVS